MFIISNLLYLSVAEALTCVGADFNDFCSDHQDAQRCKTPALWLLTGVIAGLNDLGMLGCHC